MVESPQAEPPECSAGKNPGIPEAAAKPASAEDRYKRLKKCRAYAKAVFGYLSPTADHSLAIATWALAGITVLILWDAESALHKSQRPWVVAESARTFRLAKKNDIYCRIGYKVTVRNTGNSVATSVIIDSRALSMHDDTVNQHFDDVRLEIKKMWPDADAPTHVHPIGVVLAPGQEISPIRCPAYADGADPTPEEFSTGAFVVIGYIQYSDQFSIPHHTRFAFAPDGDSVRPWDGEGYVVAEGHQEAD